MSRPTALFVPSSALAASLSLSLSLGSLGCDKGEPAASATVEPAQPAAPSEPAAPTEKAAAEPAKPEEGKAPVADRVDDPTFELKLVKGGPYKAGELGSFQVSLTPRGIYHVNQDYPMRIKVQGEAGLSLPKAELAKADAAEFGENSARFDVPFTAAAAGEHKVECEVDFAVCTPETCVPDNRTLALALPVE